VLEIACDESGYEGDKLVGTTTDVFAHASVWLDATAAAGCMRELRRRIRSPAVEYKANHLLRAKHRPVLEWLLGASGPLAGNAVVYLVDKAYFVLVGVTGLLTATTDADALYRDGPALLGPQRWNAFLLAANDLLRAKERAGAVESFFDAFAGRHDADGVLDRLRQARPRAEAFRAGDHPAGSVLDPLIPAIIRAVDRSDGPVHIAHDRQITLSQRRIAVLSRRLGGRLAGIRFVDSGFDPQVQLADILAGTARKIASDELNGHGDERLTELLRPYVDPLSVWGDGRSWSRLRDPEGNKFRVERSAVERGLAVP
jgi:hypothetical protein